MIRRFSPVLSGNKSLVRGIAILNMNMNITMKRVVVKKLIWEGTTRGVKRMKAKLIKKTIKFIKEIEMGVTPNPPSLQVSSIKKNHQNF